MNQQTPTQTPTTQTNSTSTDTSSKWTAGAIIGLIFTVLIWFISYYGAAKLSYDRFGSFGWALLAFIFAPFYYIYYAYFVSSRSVVMTAGRRLLRK